MPPVSSSPPFRQEPRFFFYFFAIFIASFDYAYDFDAAADFRYAAATRAFIDYACHGMPARRYSFHYFPSMPL